MSKKAPQPKQSTSFMSLTPFQKQKQKQRQVYIYAQVDIDKLFTEIVSKSRKVRSFVQQHHLDTQFLQKMRQYKNLRICFDNQIQQFIHKKQLSKELKSIKKNVFASLEDFLIVRFAQYLEEEKLQREYKEKVSEIEEQFDLRLKELMKDYL